MPELGCEYDVKKAKDSIGVTTSPLSLMRAPLQYESIEFSSHNFANLVSPSTGYKPTNCHKYNSEEETSYRTQQWNSTTQLYSSSCSPQPIMFVSSVHCMCLLCMRYEIGWCWLFNNGISSSSLPLLHHSLHTSKRHLGAGNVSEVKSLGIQWVWKCQLFFSIENL